jgi:hypothetical protein
MLLARVSVARIYIPLPSPSFAVHFALISRSFQSLVSYLETLEDIASWPLPPESSLWATPEKL